MTTKTKTKTSTEKRDEIRSAAESLRSAAVEKIRSGDPVTIEAMDIGDLYCQGDVGVLMVAKLPKGAKKIDPPEGGQVAPGNTEGSRHCVVGDDVKFYRFSGDNLSDLAIVSKGPWSLVHPQHGDHHYQMGGTFQIIHEQNEHRDRVLD